ncbi:hypothetical protein [Microbacterium sp. SORGH_AS_0862]|uniref:hypothetical protein n=1 Tax=Microbacterium sp. SORGH_AS_0862 TaxID=3041789 RepID=UPI0027904C89|nr:hypothetical protein [Microbacterium sp. SORGH_AS_0862]MDQ1204502.1 hypothetical protein [Microbacterium sp. SORGH_AS_0862]
MLEVLAKTTVAVSPARAMSVVSSGDASSGVPAAMKSAKCARTVFAAAGRVSPARTCAPVRAVAMTDAASSLARPEPVAVGSIAAGSIEGHAGAATEAAAGVDDDRARGCLGDGRRGRGCGDQRECGGHGGRAPRASGRVLHEL